MKRQVAVLLLIAIVLIARFATKQQQTVFIYAVLGCVWILFVFLGLKALLVRKKMSVMQNPRLFASASRERAEWLGLVFAVVGALILMFGAFTISGTRQDWSALGGIGIFIAWYFIWRGAYAIALNEALHYSSLFGGYRQIRFEEVSSSKLMVGVHPTRPTVRREIYSVGGEKPIVINRAVFRRADVESVIRWLGPKIKGHSEKF